MRRLELDLGTERLWKCFEFQGNRIVVESVEGEVKLKINHRQNFEIDLKEIREIVADFDRIFIYNQAQSGKKLILRILEEKEKFEKDEVRDLLKLFNESYSFTYDASGNISTITVTTKDKTTVTYTFTYDDSGNITSISKTIS